MGPMGLVAKNKKTFFFNIFLVFVLKLGGMTAHRKAAHVFLGITIGDAAMLGMWAILGSILNRWTLAFTY